MKDIRPALRSLLLDDPAVNALVGGSRVHSSRLPQKQIEPSVVYVKVSETGNYSMQGDTHLSQARMQVDAWAQTNGQATVLANAVYDRLSGFRGIVIVDSDALEVKGCFLASGHEDYDAEMQMFRVSRDFLLWYGSDD